MGVLQYLGRGILHEQNGAPCQDSVLARRLRNGLTVLALADGAGSAEYARLAARINCGSMVSFFGAMKTEEEFRAFLELPQRLQVAFLLSYCRSDILRHMRRKNCRDAAEFSATLLFCVIGQDNVLTGHLGDGGLYCMGQGSMLVSGADNIQGRSNATYFTVSRDAPAHLRLECFRRSDVEALLLTSDGTAKLFADPSVPATLLQAAGGELRSSRDLGEALKQLSWAPLLRMDDWSVLLWAEKLPELWEEPPRPVSMQEEELGKYPHCAGPEQRPGKVQREVE